MTLIVAYCDGVDISTVSDTSLTYNKDTLYENNFRNLPENGMLKVIIISSQIFIGFAGNSVYALKAIKLIRSVVSGNGEKIPISQIIELISIVRNNYETHIRPDFIIGQVSEKTASLHKISDNGVEKNLSTCWIGSKDAFTKYQEYLHDYKNSNQDYFERYNMNGHQRNRSAMTQAMELLIDNNDFDSVGGFYVPLHSTMERNFEYFTYMGIYGLHIPEQEHTESWQTLHFNNTAQGGYAYILLTPDDSSVAAVGFFILQLQLTIVFCPLVSNNHKIYGSQLSAQKWIKKNMGFKLSGGGFR